MANRLSKIYTRVGDDGTTGLATGERISKDQVRIQAMGDIDELNSSLGLLIAHNPPADIKDLLQNIQHILFDAGGELAIPEARIISINNIKYIEKYIDYYNKNIPPLKEFILPGGTILAAFCHQSRAICRRAERHFVTFLQQEKNANTDTLGFLNRLSDLLFVLARILSRQGRAEEIYWNKDHR